MHSLQYTCPHFVDQSRSILSRHTLHCSCILERTSVFRSVTVPSVALGGLTSALLVITVRSTISLGKSLSAETTGLPTSQVKSTLLSSSDDPSLLVDEFRDEVRSRTIDVDERFASCESATIVSLAFILETCLPMSISLLGYSWCGRVRRTVSAGIALLCLSGLSSKIGALRDFFAHLTVVPLDRHSTAVEAMR